MKRFFSMAMLFGVVLASGQAKADYAATSVTSTFAGTTSRYVGYEFTITSSINVTAVGVVSYAGYTPQAATVNYGFFDSSGNPIVADSGTISTGSATAIANGSTTFLYQAATITLGPGTYFYGVEASSLVFGAASSVTYSSALSSPSLALGNSLGFNPSQCTTAIAGNFAFGSAAVPEPASAVMVGLGLVGVVGFVARRKAARA